MSTARADLPNHSLKEDIRLYWSRRAVTFDQSPGHRIEDTIEAPAWRALFARAFGDLAGARSSTSPAAPAKSAACSSRWGQR